MTDNSSLTITTLPSAALWTINLDRLANLARQDDGAANVLVDRLLDLELERRFELIHESFGWSDISSVEMLGMPVGGDSKPAEIQYQGGGGMSQWHYRAELIIGRMPLRRQVAVLIQAAKCSPPKTRRGALWQASYSQIVGALAVYLGDLGYAPGIAETSPYKNGQALKDAARGGKTALKAALFETAGEDQLVLNLEDGHD